MARDLLLKIINQRAEKVFLIMVIAIIILTAFMTLYAQAADVNVYAEGICTDDHLELDIYADIMTRSILSFGVKLTYNPAELSVTKAEKNEDVWYFGNESLKYPYKDPDWSSEGEVDIVGGKLDTNNPLEGVMGERILMGRIIFNRSSSSISGLSLSFLREGTYKNFVATDGTVLDDKDDGVSFGQVTLQYDVDNDGYTIDEGDCDDEDPAINPGAIEICDNLDNNCDTFIDEEGAEGCVIYYRDEDEDSYGLDVDCRCLCKPEGIYTATRGGDPDDQDPLVIPVSEIDINMELDIGWSMISLPVSPDNMLLSHVFPGAVVVYGYEKGVGYIRVQEGQELEVKKGYWILLDTAQTYALTGQPILVYTSSVENGWYMIGGCSSAAQASVTTGNITVIYRYVPESGYQRVQGSENIEPGNGYWILFSNITGQAELRVEKK